MLGTKARVVRGLLFDKTPDANWKVAWHQDLSIAVRQRIEVPGFGPWSNKAGVTHVQPPVAVLENMITVRLHLDDCGPENGPLRVLPGSHSAGVLAPASIGQWTRDVAPVDCHVAAGGAVVMRPLLLHASSTANCPGHRRVVHLEFASGPLPGGLEWFEA
jgi:ectoine hydroxylase-related dioxygenase (phytanoyl-CoA dioxygenase family)